MVLIYLKSHVPKIIKSPSIESRDLLTEDAEHNPLNSTVDGNEEKEETAVGELADLPATTESLSESDTINTVEEEEDLVSLLFSVLLLRLEKRYRPPACFGREVEKRWAERASERGDG